MEITKVIIKNNARWGVMIEDTGLVYPITMECLHNKALCKLLIAAGWKLYGVPYDFRKDGITFDLLPTVNYENINITDSQIDDIEDMKFNLYSNSELIELIDENTDVEYHFREGMNAIKTREQFLDFLEGIKTGRLNETNPMSYMPLNSFVSPAALFSVDDYLSDKYAYYREIIERRRNLSIRRLRKLVADLKKMGLEENYTVKNLLDMYFSWGIDGIRFKMIAPIVNEDNNILLGVTDNPLEEDAYRSFVETNVLSYVDSNGKVFRPDKCTGNVWKHKSNEILLQSKVSSARASGLGFVEPEYLVARTIEKVTVLKGDKYTIKYNTTTICIEEEGRMIYDMPTLKLTATALTNTSLHTKYLRLGGDRDKELYDELSSLALCKFIVDKTRVRTDVSSVKALQLSGASPMGVLIYALNNSNVIEDLKKAQVEQYESNGIDIMSKSKETRKALLDLSPVDYLKMIDSYLQGDLQAVGAVSDTIEELVDIILSGEYNIDSVGKGEQSDDLVDGISTYKQKIDVAHRYLGLSFSDIYNKLRCIEETTNSVELEGNGLKVKLNIVRADKKDLGFYEDREYYRALTSQDAVYFLYVQEAFRELGPKAIARKHVGFKGLAINMSDRKTANLVGPLKKKADKIIYDYVSRYVDSVRQEAYTNRLNLISMEVLFGIGVSGEYQLPKVLGGDIIKVDKPIDDIDEMFTFDDMETIRAVMKQVVDSTLNFADLAISPSGRFASYCVNAYVFPEYIVPRGKKQIKEVALIAAWKNTVGEHYDELRARWATKGYISSRDFKGYSVHGGEYSLPISENRYGFRYDWTNDSKGLNHYYKRGERFITTFPIDKEIVCPLHPLYENYKHLDMLKDDKDKTTFDDDGNVNEYRQREGEHKPYNIAVSAPVMVTQEDMLSRSENLRRLFSAEKVLIENMHGFSEFNTFDIDELVNLDEYKFLDSLDIQGEIAMDGLKDEQIAIFEGKEVHWTEIPRLYETGRYKIKHLSGNSYLCETIYGKLVEVKC